MVQQQRKRVSSKKVLVEQAVVTQCSPYQNDEDEDGCGNDNDFAFNGLLSSDITTKVVKKREVWNVDVLLRFQY